MLTKLFVEKIKEKNFNLMEMFFYSALINVKLTNSFKVEVYSLMKVVMDIILVEIIMELKFQKNLYNVIVGSKILKTNFFMKVRVNSR